MIKHAQKFDVVIPVYEVIKFCFKFQFVEPTNKRYLLGIDVSGSMSYGGCHGTTVITPAEASAAMAMLALKTEPSTTPMAFASDFVPLKINKDMKLDDVLRETRKVCFIILRIFHKY